MTAYIQDNTSFDLGRLYEREIAKILVQAMTISIEEGALEIADELRLHEALKIYHLRLLAVEEGSR